MEILVNKEEKSELFNLSKIGFSVTIQMAEIKKTVEFHDSFEHIVESVSLRKSNRNSEINTKTIFDWSRKLATGILLLLFVFKIQLCNSQDFNDISLTPSVPSLVGNDHTFLSYVAKLKTGRILHIFRLDPGISGNHVGNGGTIVKRYSDDDGKTWTSPVTIYKDSLDDRVFSGGVLDNGNIVIFFGRYKTINIWGGSYIDYNLISSSDNGETWSKRVTLSSINGLQSGIFKIDTIPGYFSTTYNNNFADIRYSPDGYNWDSVYYKWDYTKTKQFNLYEPTITSVGDGRLIALFRQENNPLYQSVSSDYGRTWTMPDTTSIANYYYCVAPFNLYDSKLKKLITITSDRRGGSYSELNKNSGLWVYCNNPDSVFDNPNGYDNPHFINRSNHNTFRLLGYPSVTKLNDFTFLVIYSDDYKKSNDLENADFYQFQIKIDKDVYLQRITQVITFDNIPKLNHSSPIYKLKATASSGLPVSFKSSDTLIAKIVNGKLQIINPGSCIIYAMQNGNSKYFPAKTIERRIIIDKASQTISFNAIPNLKFGSPACKLSANSSSSLPVTFVSSDTLVAEVENDSIKIVGAGTCVITAIQSGNNKYKSISYSQSLTVDKAPQTITFDRISQRLLINDTLLINAFASSGLAVSFYSSDTNVIRIVNGKFVTVNIGTCVIGAYQNGNTNFESAPVNSQSIEVFESLDLSVIQSYPNLTKGEITVSNIQDARLEILNLSGTVLLSDNSLENERSFDLSNCNSGLYLIKITTKDSKTITRRFVLSH